MDIPDLVKRALGDEEIRVDVSLGDEDAVCLTPTRALVYNGEGLISDEGVEEFPLDVERLSVKRGRRKTKFRFQYIDGRRSFTVPSNRDEEVLEHLLEGIFRLESVVDPRESVVGVYLFSELTLVVTDRRLVKHVGEAVWDGDYEVYDFADVTGLDFERTSVATSIVLGIDGHPQRVKVPNDNAPVLRRTLQDALFEFHDVASLDELNRVLGTDVEEPDDVETSAGDDDLTFGSGIDPLVTDRDDDPAKGVEDPFAAESVGDGAIDDAATVGEDDAADDPTAEAPTADSAKPDAGSDEKSGDGTEATGADSGAGSGGGTEPEAGAEVEGDGTASDSDTRAGGESTTGRGEATDPEPATREDVEAVADRLEELTDAVDRQNELLKRQHRAMKQLVERLDAE